MDEVNLNNLLLLQEIWKSVQETLKLFFILVGRTERSLLLFGKMMTSLFSVRVEAFKDWTQRHPIVVLRKRSNLIFWTCIL